MSLAAIEAICTVPLSVYILVDNIRYLRPYRGWADLHWGFSRVDQFPSMLWRLSPHLVFGLELTRWSSVICAFIFFAFFGFTDECREPYRLAYVSLAERLGYPTASNSGTTNSTT